MKLVDILARELDRWVGWGDKIVQDDDGYIVAFEHEAELKCVDGDWKGPSCDPICVLDLAEDHKTSIVTRAEWQAAVDALNAPKVVEWDGVGDPPVGTVCEYDARPSGKGEPLFVTVEVKYVSDQSIVIICTDVPDGENKENIGVELALMNGISMLGKFRAIRTAEQVAAEELEKEIADMMEVTSDGITCMDRDDALALYKAGYRKQVAK